MDRFTKDDLQQLISQQAPHAVSILMPTIRAGRETRQNSIRYKNLLSDAEQQLIQRGLLEPQVGDLLNEARRRSDDTSFWQRQSDGFAAFVSQNLWKYYRVPVELPEQVVVAERFHVAPMWRLLENDGRFYILAVSQKRVRLLEGSQLSVDELQPESLPTDLRSALNIDEYQESLQHHSAGTAAARGTAARQTTIFHGHGSAGQEVKKQDEIKQFLHRIDSALNAFLQRDSQPLVFAGVEYLFGMFKEISMYRRLVGEAVQGNTDELRPDEIHAKAWPLVEPLFAKARQETLRAYRDATGSQLTAEGIKQVVIAARRAQVATLLTAGDQCVWGRFDPETEQFDLADQNSAAAEDLVNYAVAQTLLHGGQVFTLPPEQLPGGEPVAAVLRYPASTQSVGAKPWIHPSNESLDGQAFWQES